MKSPKLVIATDGDGETGREVAGGRSRAGGGYPATMRAKKRERAQRGRYWRAIAGNLISDFDWRSLRHEATAHQTHARTHRIKHDVHSSGGGAEHVARRFGWPAAREGGQVDGGEDDSDAANEEDKNKNKAAAVFASDVATRRRQRRPPPS